MPDKLPTPEQLHLWSATIPKLPNLNAFTEKDLSCVERHLERMEKPATVPETPLLPEAAFVLELVALRNLFQRRALTIHYQIDHENEGYLLFPRAKMTKAYEKLRRPPPGLQHPFLKFQDDIENVPRHMEEMLIRPMKIIICHLDYLLCPPQWLSGNDRPSCAHGRREYNACHALEMQVVWKGLNIEGAIKVFESLEATLIEMDHILEDRQRFRLKPWVSWHDMIYMGELQMRAARMRCDTIVPALTLLRRMNVRWLVATYLTGDGVGCSISSSDTFRAIGHRLAVFP